MTSPSFGSGFLTYNTNIIKGILEKDDGNEYFVFINEELVDYFSIPNGKNIHLFKVSKKYSKTFLRYFWMQIILPIKILFYNIDVVFSPMNIMPLVLKIIRTKCVSVIHNNLPWLYPRDVPGSKIKSFLQRFLTNLTIKYSNKLIVDSQIAKDELVEIFPFILDKTEMVYMGIDKDSFLIKRNSKNFFNPKIDILKDTYFLTIASAVRYHCLEELILGFNSFAAEMKESRKLLLISRNLDSQYFAQIKKLLRNLYFKENIIIIEDLERNLIPTIYTNADLYIYPSYCDVFGLTNIEAMLCGVPVLTTKLSAIPEICGNAAAYFNPRDPNDLKNKLLQIYLNDKMKNKLIKRGFIQANKYTWDNACEKTKSIIIND